MNDVLTFLSQHGALLLFAVVFAEQIGLPLPAIPLLVAAGVLAGTGHLPLIFVISGVVVAALAADWIWYELGRRRGHHILGLICRIALEPQSCVARTAELFRKHGARSLVLAKFIPGFSTIAPPLAGIAGLSLPLFLLYDGLGVAVWAGSAIGLGYVFSERMESAIEYAAVMTPVLLAALTVVVSAYVVGKAVRRRRDLGQVPRMTAEELHVKLAESEPPVLVDVRSRTIADLDPGLPGALVIPADELSHRYHELPADRDIVVYCACPGDLASAQMVRFLIREGLRRAWVLKGGVEAWRTFQAAGKSRPMSGPVMVGGMLPRVIGLEYGDDEQVLTHQVNDAVASTYQESARLQEVPC